MKVNQTSISQPLQLFLSNLIADKAASGQEPLLLQDNARCHGNEHPTVQKPGTPCNSFHKRQGTARWNDSFEVNEHHQSPTNLLISPNSVISLDRLVSPRRRESLVASSRTGHGQLRMSQKESRTMKGTTAAFLASLPMDDGSDECR